MPLSERKTISWTPTADIRGGAQAVICHASVVQDVGVIWPRFPLRLPMMATGFPNPQPEKRRIHVRFRNAMSFLLRQREGPYMTGKGAAEAERLYSGSATPR